MSNVAADLSALDEAPPEKTYNLVGLNHRTSPIELREVFAKLERDSQSQLANIVETCGLKEAAILSTCNRFEIISVGADSENQLLSYLRGHIRSLQPENCYSYRNGAAVRHLMRVASSLDSMVRGEGQILQQVRQAYQRSVSMGLAQRHLHHLFQLAVHTAKEVRSQTGIARKAVSVSYIAVKLAEQIFGDLSDRTAMVIGSGRMAELAAIHLRSHKCSDIIVANRTPARASELADRIQGTAAALSDLEKHLRQVDIVIGSISVHEPLITRELLNRLPRSRSLFFIDLGVPRNFAPEIGELDGVFLYNIDDLSSIAEKNRSIRDESVREAEVIIDYGVAQYERWLVKQAAQPRVLTLRSKIRSVCEEELRKALRPYLPEQDLDRIMEGLPTRVAQRISHDLTKLVEHSPGGKLDPESLMTLLFDDYFKV